MASVNTIIILGRLGADPETKRFDNGRAVTELRIATNERWKDRDGNPKEHTEWHTVKVWGAQADACAQCLRKGREVFVEGRLQSRKYTDKQGVERRVYEIDARRVQFVGGKDQEAA